MIFRTLLNDAEQLVVRVENEAGVIFERIADDAKHAASLVKQAVDEGIDSIRPEDPKAKGK